MSDYRVVYIVGSGRCGSTLLDLLLNGHSQILGLGELSTLNTAADPLADGDASTYGSFWAAVRDRFERRHGGWDGMNLQHGRWGQVLRQRGPDLEGWLARNRAVFDSVHDVDPSPILTDASKWPQRLGLLLRDPTLDVWVIELLRDGRAVTNSYVQRYEDFWGGLRVWATATVTGRVLRARVPRHRWLRMRYEDLATDPEATLRGICAFLSIGYEPAMSSYRETTYLGLGGNPNTRAGGGQVIALDERWRHQLRRRDRLAFAVVGGWLNLLCGYGWRRSKLSGS